MNLDIAREVTAALAERESVSIAGWKWRKGVVLFPEARCPFCQDVMRSRAIWVVHGYNLVGQAVPRSGRELKLDPPKHPHATPSNICMGNAVDPLQALFAGLNPKSSYFNPDNEYTGGMGAWLRGPYWEHDCAELQSVRIVPQRMIMRMSSVVLVVLGGITMMPVTQVRMMSPIVIIVSTSISSTVLTVVEPTTKVMARFMMVVSTVNPVSRKTTSPVKVAL